MKTGPQDKSCLLVCTKAFASRYVIELVLEVSYICIERDGFMVLFSVVVTVLEKFVGYREK